MLRQVKLGFVRLGQDRLG